MSVAQIRRQGETHDPQRVRGPASVRNQVRSVGLVVDAVAPGRLRITAPGARGWVRVVRTRDELAAAIAEAFTEAQIASYAMYRGHAYDRDAETPIYRDDQDPLIAAAHHGAARPRGRSDIHDPRDWTPLGDGTWRSPGGKVFGSETAAVRRVKAKRAQLGLV